MDKLYVTRMTNDDDRGTRELQPESQVRDADHDIGRVPPCRAVERCASRPPQRQSRVRRNEHGDAAWLFNRSLIGDPVVTTGSSRGIEYGNGYSDWNMSYAKYEKGSAL